MRRLRAQAGLTLLEMIVVLMIAAMALTLGFQSLTQWQRSDAAIAGVTGDLRQAKLVESWLRGAVRGLVPVEEQPFEGEPTGWSGLTLGAVLSSQGGSTTQAWRVLDATGEVALELTEFGRASVFPLPGVISARFAYLDPEGGTHDRWPPALGTGSNLPSAVALELVFEDSRTQWWATAIGGAADPVYLPFEMEQD